ncbi:hypothetical protein WN982_12725 [Paraburkholderia sp. IMGN_8]|uniref:hypothetical protein n=1 Tax=Paraburkholderia sp. IMGN_8 TaxID=3136564 RepID=UPI003101A8C3
MNALFALALCMMVGYVFAQTTPDTTISVKKISDSEVSVKMAGSEHRCRIDQQVVDAKVSSDRQAVIISGTSYIPTADLERCNSDVVTHAIKAAPHVGFLADVNLNARIYVSLIPLSVNPMSFVAVVAKIGSDRNLINLQGFYGAGVKQSTLLSEASSVMSPTLSVDARYVSLDLHACESDGDEYVSVIEIRSAKQIKLSRAMCEKEFRFQ